MIIKHIVHRIARTWCERSANRASVRVVKACLLIKNALNILETHRYLRNTIQTKSSITAWSWIDKRWKQHGLNVIYDTRRRVFPWIKRQKLWNFATKNWKHKNFNPTDSLTCDRWCISGDSPVFNVEPAHRQHASCVRWYFNNIRYAQHLIYRAVFGFEEVTRRNSNVGAKMPGEAISMSKLRNVFCIKVWHQKVFFRNFNCAMLWWCNLSRRLEMFMVNHNFGAQNELNWEISSSVVGSNGEKLFHRRKTKVSWLFWWCSRWAATSDLKWEKSPSRSSVCQLHQMEEFYVKWISCITNNGAHHTMIMRWLAVGKQLNGSASEIISN